MNITGYIKNREEEFEKTFKHRIEKHNGDYSFLYHDIRDFHHDTILGVLERVQEVVEHIEIKGRNTHDGDDTKEKGELLQEMYDRMIKPVLLSSLTSNQE